MTLLRWMRDWWRSILYVLFLVLVVASLLAATSHRQRIAANQQRILVNQASLEDTQDALAAETQNRIDAVCRTALDTRQIIREVVTEIEDASSDESTLRDPHVKAAIDRIVSSRPVTCPTQGDGLSQLTADP